MIRFFASEDEVVDAESLAVAVEPPVDASKRKSVDVKSCLAISFNSPSEKDVVRCSLNASPISE